MADIEVVIKIPEEEYELCKRQYDTECLDTLMIAVKYGTPLPKGHGNLKDMDDIYETLEGWEDDTGWIVDAIDWQAPTIIEADKTKSEK